MSRLVIVLIVLAIVGMAIVLLSDVAYYKESKIGVGTLSQPIMVIKPPNATYIREFTVQPTGVNMKVSLDQSQVLYVNGTGHVNITIMEIKALRPGFISFSVSGNSPVVVTFSIYSSNGSLIGEYPSEKSIELSPGNYYIVEDITFPGNSNSIHIECDYTYMLDNVILLGYSLREVITING